MGWVRRPRGGRGWEARYRGSDGCERSRSFRTKGEAQRFLAGVEAQLQRGEWRDPALARTTLAEWVEEWMGTTVHLRPATRALYEYLLRCHVLHRFGSYQLGRIAPVDARAWLAELKSASLSPSTIRKAFRVLSGALGAAVECNLIGHSPCASIKPPPEPSREMRFLSAQEVAELAEAIGPDYESLVYTAAYTGLRWGELAGLRRKHVDLLRRTIRVIEQLTEVNGTFAFGPPKTKAGQRRVAVPRFVVEHRERQLEERSESGPDGLVFPAAEGGPMRRSNFKSTRLAAGTARRRPSRGSLPRPPPHRGRTRHRGRSPPQSAHGAPRPLVDQRDSRPLRPPAPRPRPSHRGPPRRNAPPDRADAAWVPRTPLPAVPGAIAMIGADPRLCRHHAYSAAATCMSRGASHRHAIDRANDPSVRRSSRSSRPVRSCVANWGPSGPTWSSVV
jgi:integrase